MGFTEPVYDPERPGEVGMEEVKALVGETLAGRWETLKEKVRVESGESLSLRVLARRTLVNIWLKWSIDQTRR